MTRASLLMLFLAAGAVLPSFKYLDDKGNASGPWIEMTEKVAAEAGYRIYWVHLPIARVYLHLQNGNIDLWPGVAGIPALQGSVYESTVTPMNVVLYAFHRSNTEPPDSLEFLMEQPL
jgi:polar amino acid transport system substrate-binding protein